MKLLLVAINSKYIHSNMAVHSLRKYAINNIGENYCDSIALNEYTINNSNADILKGIYEEKADVIAFSCYIWNVILVKEIIKDIKKIQPNIHVWLGGPEVSYDAKEFLQSNTCVKGVMIGEGEETFKELLEYYLFKNLKLKEIKSLAFREDKNIYLTPLRPQMNMNDIPFPYDDLNEFENKIIYYESSRGCPFSCSYCLSSIDKNVRFRDIDLVKKELALFIDKKIAQVKFVDRTFNCSKKHSMEIWKFIKEKDNGITNFHFEISADIITNEEIELLSTLRPGQVQFEIGVQSTNLDTVKAIHRTMDFKLVSEVVQKLQKSNNIHIHLDVIAGLPNEGFESFQKTFNDVYLLRPEQLQLGFLKVLKGSLMKTESTLHEIVTSSKPPYEVLSTKWLNYDEILCLKSVEDMVDTYYNSCQFTYSIMYLEHFFDNPMELYIELGNYYKKNKLDLISHSRLRRYDILLNFYREICVKLNLGKEYYLVFEEILLFDLYLREKLKSRPDFIKKQNERTQNHVAFYKNRSKAYNHLEYFDFDIIRSAETGQAIKKKIHVKFDYTERDIITKNAKTEIISDRD
ncbi:MAG TPA: DUF4080 domain-containing protein [Clostridiales bacterium]|nr:DUF4080 domain-containing protein [Clostridiales bacterium]